MARFGQALVLIYQAYEIYLSVLLFGGSLHVLSDRSSVG